MYQTQTGQKTSFINLLTFLIEPQTQGQGQPQVGGHYGPPGLPGHPQRAEDNPATEPQHSPREDGAVCRGVYTDQPLRVLRQVWQGKGSALDLL